MHPFVCLFIHQNFLSSGDLQTLWTKVSAFRGLIVQLESWAGSLATKIDTGHEIQAKLGGVQFLPHLLAEGIWAGSFTSLSLTFLVCKVAALTLAGNMLQLRTKCAKRLAWASCSQWLFLITPHWGGLSGFSFGASWRVGSKGLRRGGPCSTESESWRGAYQMRGWCGMGRGGSQCKEGEVWKFTACL